MLNWLFMDMQNDKKIQKADYIININQSEGDVNISGKDEHSFENISNLSQNKSNQYTIILVSALILVGAFVLATLLNKPIHFVAKNSGKMVSENIDTTRSKRPKEIQSTTTEHPAGNPYPAISTPPKNTTKYVEISLTDPGLGLPHILLDGQLKGRFNQNKKLIAFRPTYKKQVLQLKYSDAIYQYHFTLNNFIENPDTLSLSIEEFELLPRKSKKQDTVSLQTHKLTNNNDED